MKVCVYGAGAVGGHLAVRLATGGAEVSVVARGEHLRGIQENGLRVETRNGVLHHRLLATDTPTHLGRQDLVIVTVKSPALPQIVDGLESLLDEDTLVVFTMNGIPWWYFHEHGGELDGTQLNRLDPGGKLWHKIGPERVVGGVAYTACTVREPGVIVAENPRNRLILGRPDGKGSVKLQLLADILRRGGLEVELTEKIRDAIWSKLLMNITGGVLGILSCAAMKDTLSNPSVFKLATIITNEAVSIANNLGCVTGDPAEGLARLATSTHKQSILQDLVAGRNMEIDPILQVPLDLARLSGIETPYLDMVVGLAIRRAISAGLYNG